MHGSSGYAATGSAWTHGVGRGGRHRIAAGGCPWMTRPNPSFIAILLEMNDKFWILDVLFWT
jgi:hypothetical protein